MDPLLDEDLKKERMKRNQKYQDYLNQVHKADKKNSAEGNLLGKKVKQISSEDSSVQNLFKPFK